MTDITANELRNRLRYEPETGKFFWLRNSKEAGCHRKEKKNGYITINIDNTWHQAHRLVWLYVYGTWPEKHIDHINGEGSDNRLCNLREATVSQNIANSRFSKANKTGYKGVALSGKCKKYRAQIMKDGKQQFLGYFDDPEEAHAAYIKAANDNFGEFARSA